VGNKNDDGDVNVNLDDASSGGDAGVDALLFQTILLWEIFLLAYNLSN